MLRLTGGEFRGRQIQTPPDRPGKAFLRPTQARLRQALFNSIQTMIADAKVLDLFGGSGALGFEALSRGAGSVVFVEDSRVAVKLIEKNAATLRCEDRVRIIADSVAHLMKRVKGLGPFDLVLADPPYAEGWETKLLEDMDWSELLAPEGVFCLEWGTQKSRVDSLPDETPSLVKVREKNYGDSVLTTYQRSS
jgi:16S rRNA (guanine966-N2)-methyltransferase